jgi:hypothetical protein
MDYLIFIEIFSQYFLSNLFYMVEKSSEIFSSVILRPQLRHEAALVSPLGVLGELLVH